MEFFLFAIHSVELSHIANHTLLLKACLSKLCWLDVGVAHVVQLVEPRQFNPEIMGSIPGVATFPFNSKNKL